MESVKLPFQGMGLLFLLERGGFNPAAQLAPAFFKTIQRLLEREDLLRRSGECGDLGDAQQNIIERRDIIEGRKHLHGGGGMLIGGGEQRGQSGLEVVPDGVEIGLHLLAGIVGDLPLVGGKRGNGVLDAVERRLEDGGGIRGTGMKDGLGTWLCRSRCLG